MNKTVTSIFFSPSGTTAICANQIANTISANVKTIDLLKNKITEELLFTENDILVVAMPVYAGRIPGVCAKMLQHLKGNNTPAIAAAVYGNRHYDDALLELSTLLIQNGFVLAGAATLVAQHSIFPQVANGRPDASDLDKIKNFAVQCAATIENNVFPPLKVPGNTPYREATPVKLPIPVSAKCNNCGACASICPMQAISKENPRETDIDKCISCTACIHICPQQARKYRGLKYFLGSKVFKKKCTVRREPEFFPAIGT